MPLRPFFRDFKFTVQNNFVLSTVTSIVGVNVLYFMLLLLVLFYCRSECAVLYAFTVVLFYCRSECAVFHAPTVLLFYCRSECAVFLPLMLVLFYCRSECAVPHVPTFSVLLLQE